MDLWIEKSTLDKFVAVGEVEDISFGNKGNIMILFHPKDTPKKLYVCSETNFYQNFIRNFENNG